MNEDRKPKVSVIIPIYNHAKFIGEAIRSVLDQSYQDFEIIITNDGSTDNTLEAINKFSDPRIKVFTFEKNKGISNALNNCIVNSKGEYIALLNSDDTFLHDKLKKQVDFLEENKNTAAVFTLANIIDEDSLPFKDKDHFYFSIFDQPNRNKFEWLNHFFYNGNCLCHPSMMIRRQCFESVGYYDIRFHQMQDLELYVRICMKYDIYIIQERLVNFRVLDNEANTSGNRPDSRNRTAWEMEKILDNYLEIEMEEFETIFPELKNFKMPLKKALVPFYISIIVSKINSAIYKHFALQTLYDLFGDKEKIEIMQKIENFDSQSFVRLTGELDAFQINVSDNLNIELKKYQQDIQQKDQELHKKEQEIKFMKASKFWKLREVYLKIKNYGRKR